MLLINIGEAAVTLYDLATKKTGEANEYLNTRATLESIYCLPQPHCKAQIRFNRVKPLQNESPIQYIERLEMATELCNLKTQTKRSWQRFWQIVPTKNGRNAGLPKNGLKQTLAKRKLMPGN